MPLVQSRCQRPARHFKLLRKQPQVRNQRLKGFPLCGRLTKKPTWLAFGRPPPAMKRIPGRRRAPGGDFLRDQEWCAAEAGKVDVQFSVTRFPLKKLSRPPSRGRMPNRPGPARRPRGGLPARSPLPPLAPEDRGKRNDDRRSGAKHHECRSSMHGGQRLRHLTCPTEPADLSAHNRCQTTATSILPPGRRRNNRPDASRGLRDEIASGP